MARASRSSKRGTTAVRSISPACVRESHARPSWLVSPAVRTLSLKVDVDTLRGTREGVPRLATLFTQLRIPATFLFSLGPDHTGRALKRVFRPGFLRKVRRTSVASHYGLRTLLYGTLLPGPDIGRK